MSAALYLTRARLKTGRGEQLSAIAPALLRGSKGDTVGNAHRILWMLFRDRDENEPRDFLWREEKPGHYLVLSRRAPTDPSNLFEIKPKDYDPQLKAGDRLDFVLRVNPVVSRKVEGARGMRCDIVMNALHELPGRSKDDKRGESVRAKQRDALTQTAAEKWVAAQGERSGFKLVLNPENQDKPFLVATNYETIKIPRGKEDAKTGEWRLENKDRFAQFGVLDLSGLIEVTDAGQFLEQLVKGFGKAKAFGYGLMLIKRAA